MFICNDRSQKVKFDYFDMNFKHLPFQQGGEHFNGEIIKPQCFERMKDLSVILSQNVPLLRVDF